MNVPEPKSIEIVLFGQTVSLTERTAEERFQLEDAMSNRNGDGSALTYIASLKAIECALSKNVKRLPSFLRPIKRREVRQWNKIFEFNNLKKLSWTQIEFLLNEINKLEWGDKYEELKKKALAAAIDSQEKPSED
jgi:hypothetical protein